MSALPVHDPKSSRSLSPVHHINVALSIRPLYQQISRVLSKNIYFFKFLIGNSLQNNVILVKYLRCVYLNLSSDISTSYKNGRCLKELIKIAYDPPISIFQLISINFMKNLIKKKLIHGIKTDHLNEKIVFLKNNDKYRKQLSEKLCKKLVNFLKNYIKKNGKKL